MGPISLKHSIFISLLKIFSNVFWQSSKLNYPHRSKTVPSLLVRWTLLDFIYFLVYKKMLIKVVENVSIQNYLFCRSKESVTQTVFPALWLKLYEKNLTWELTGRFALKWLSGYEHCHLETFPLLCQRLNMAEANSNFFNCIWGCFKTFCIKVAIKW